MHPQDNFRTVFAGGLDLEVHLHGPLGRLLKKGRQLFWQEKVHPADKILATPMGVWAPNLARVYTQTHTIENAACTVESVQ